MPELLLELFSEEIPARMQQGAADSLARLVTDALAPLAPTSVETFSGPRRIALAATVSADVPAASTIERGPRTAAPPQALDGFLRKHGAARDQLTEEGGHWVLTKASAATPAETLIAAALPGLLRRFPWPKSMRWGDGSLFTWVRPLRRILCVLDGATVPFTLADNADDGHGLHSGHETEGHRFHAPGAFPAPSLAAWRDGLLARHVVPDAATRRQRITDGIAGLAAAEGLVVVPDAGLVDEVAGLCEWPVPLLGRIDDAYMDLPPEVMQVSMRVNQRYFALRNADGTPAPRFGFAANIEASDGGAAIIVGNERVLRARFSDARHFWNLDRATPLVDRVPALSGITFHAKLGTQAARVDRIATLAGVYARMIFGSRGSGLESELSSPDLAMRAAYLSKADLTTGMVAEFPELQGVMGAYYAEADKEPPQVVTAIRQQYQPRGPSDSVPTEDTAIAVALADKIDQLTGFFLVDQAPTGSSDPYALRRAGLGVIRIIRENSLRYFKLDRAIEAASAGFSQILDVTDLHLFLLDRLRIQLRAEGYKNDVIMAVFKSRNLISNLAMCDIGNRVSAISSYIYSPAGRSLVNSARRAMNILPDKSVRSRALSINEDASMEKEEVDLIRWTNMNGQRIFDYASDAQYEDAMRRLTTVGPLLEQFFSAVTVNVDNRIIRDRRLIILSSLVGLMNLIADFSQIEG